MGEFVCAPHAARGWAQAHERYWEAGKKTQAEKGNVITLLDSYNTQHGNPKEPLQPQKCTTMTIVPPCCQLQVEC